MTTPREIDHLLLLKDEVLSKRPLQGFPFEYSIYILERENGQSKEVKEYQVFEKLQVSHHIQLLVVEGNRGVGKSAFLHKILEDAANHRLFQKYTMVIPLDLESPVLWEVHSFGDICSKYLDIAQCFRAPFLEILQNEPQQVLITLDGWDEYTENNPQWKKSFIAGIVKRGTSSIIITSRPSCMHKLYKLASPDVHLLLKGFKYIPLTSRYTDRYTPNLIFTFLRQKSMEKGITSVDIDRLVEYLGHHKAAYKMCHVPCLAIHVLEIYKANTYLLPETLTAFMNSVVLKVIQQGLARKHQTEVSISELSHIDKLPIDTLVTFKHCCTLALADLLNNGQLDARSVSYLLLGEGIAGLQDVTGLGLVEAVTFPRRHRRTMDQPVYTFLHSTIRDFMAAYCLTQAPVVKQQKLFVNCCCEVVKSSDNFCENYFGLACLNKATFSTAKLGLPCSVECLLHELTSDKKLSGNHLLYILSCLHETQEPSLVKTCASKHEELLSMKLGGPDRKLTDHECSLLAFFILNSGIWKWRCEFVNSEQKHKVEFLLFLSTSSSRTPVEFNVKQGSTFLIEAVDPPKSSKKFVFSPHSLYCRSIKDTLHQVFQMYSPVRVRSDSDDPGYTSYISCRCLEKVFESEVVIEPIHVMHCIDLPPKNKSRTEADNRHLEEAHDMKRMEVIQLSTPYLNSVRFVFPGTREEMLVKLSSEWEPYTSPMESRIIKEVGDIFDEGKLMPCYEQVDRSRPKVVVPDLPLPRKNHVNQIPTAKHQGHGDQAATAERLRQSLAVTAEHLGTTSQVVGSFATQAIAVEHGAQQSRSKKRVAKPGTILYSRMPHIMTSDRIYALPNESQCIRRGGNGQIFVGTYAGTIFAIKKTVFRSREFAILSKVQHKNVIPLLILMVGEQHPQHRRRYYCYHFMPKMTGDCARMITDHRSLTLKELQHSYSDNPRDMGVVLGNLRYLLAEILRGLHYLHSCHIVHRDVKASNILIKMHCMHDNPLTCLCANKCSVVVSDFDAAVELDSSDHLQPMQQSSSQQQGTLSQRDVFLVVPVGTLGFRAPECSMLSVSDSISVIDPPLTTKADIWSFGMFLLRLLIGSEGPCSQREIAMLLLHYNHQRKQTRNVNYPSPPQPKISEPLLHRLLKLSALTEELKGVSSEAIDVVRQCLQVDPDVRASAQVLLQHSFLRVQPPHYQHDVCTDAS